MEPDEPDADAQFRAFVLARRDTPLRVALLITTDRGRDPFSYARRIVVNAKVDRWRRDRGREVITENPPDTAGPDLAAGVA